MSGHNKWSTIKHKKGAADAKRSKIFSKLVKEIQVAVKEGGPDPDHNARLRLVIQNAKGVSMPKDNIERAVKGGNKDAASFFEVTFEGYLPNAVAVFIECTTDNQQRSVSNIRSIFNKYNGNLGTNGSLSFLFERKGIFSIPKENYNADEHELELIDAGAEDISDDGDYITITTAMDDFGKMQKKMEELKIVAENARLQRIPNDYKKLGLEETKKILKAIETFEEDDDVQNVYHNMEIPDEYVDQLED
ncbi:MAG TPA: YebC/PmpR family DNA-binding transcriptional regulator [Bacteroidales bacterium]|nr:YebC/PmpR family DNA-binding transcriptional regulator [Bacteroidales bacterium]HPI85475.1 YebC/PmpR family DNA-binding transcriptional regulator [Bacteroidales bacterium]HPM93431.1 YebC/PmpR family DNA-binding transcriptional regulator [Bacteroidales bacterium]